jgi:hypothetical protein
MAHKMQIICMSVVIARIPPMMYQVLLRDGLVKGAPAVN